MIAHASPPGTGASQAGEELERLRTEGLATSNKLERAMFFIDLSNCIACGNNAPIFAAGKWAAKLFFLPAADGRDAAIAIPQGEVVELERVRGVDHAVQIVAHGFANVPLADGERFEFVNGEGNNEKPNSRYQDEWPKPNDVEPANTYVILMERVIGVDFSVWVGRLPVHNPAARRESMSKLLAVAIETLEVLRKAHNDIEGNVAIGPDLHIFHGDIKGNNVMVADNSAVVIDWGGYALAFGDFSPAASRDMITSYQKKDAQMFAMMIESYRVIYPYPCELAHRNCPH